MFLASENIDFTGLAHVFLLGGGEAYVLYDALDDQDELENVASEMKQYFNICISI